MLNRKILSRTLLNSIGGTRDRGRPLSTANCAGSDTARDQDHDADLRGDETMSNAAILIAPKGANRPRVNLGSAYIAVTPDTILDYSILNLVARGCKAAAAWIRTRVIEPRHKRAELKRAAATLRGMSNYHLKDIGLSRAEITATVYGAVEQPVRRRRSAPPEAPKRRRRQRPRHRGQDIPHVSTTIAGKARRKRA